jgi:hypothetical protein
MWSTSQRRRASDVIGIFFPFQSYIAIVQRPTKTQEIIREFWMPDTSESVRRWNFNLWKSSRPLALYLSSVGVLDSVGCQDLVSF